MKPITLVTTFSLGLLFALPLSHAQFDLGKIDTLASSKLWHRLLHYKKSFPLRRLRSQVDGPEFFFSPDGKTDPKAEMLATIEAFSKNLEIGKFKQHPQCAFPERYRFLKTELGLKIKDVACPKLEEFLKKFNAHSATLVFSSAYPNNPGSMFGHTFLRINSKNLSPDQKKMDLLDWGISFAAAVADDENPFAFMALGLTGGYLGQFSMVPYYSKINEYTNSESRDVWEYDLNLNEQETTSLLRHAWEIETNSWFEYFFFDENCAYELLTLLEVAKPDWDLSEFFIYVIPAETIKKLNRIPGAITQVKFRPSLRKKMMQKYSALNADQKTKFDRITAGSLEPAATADPLLLESVVAYLYYERQKTSGKLAPEQESLLRKTLVARSQAGGTAKADQLPAVSEESRPENGHDPFRVGTSGGVQYGLGNRTQKAQYFQELQFKFAYHDLLNDDLGYTPFSQIDFPGIVLRYATEDRKLNIEQITGFEVTSLSTLTFLERAFSWKMKLDYYSPKDFQCAYCHAFRFEAGGGAAAQVFSDKVLAYTLLTADIEGSDSFHKGFRFSPKLQVAALANPLKRFKVRLGGNLETDLFQDDRKKYFYRLEFDQAYSLGARWDIRAGLLTLLRTSTALGNYKEAKFTLNHYF